MKQKMDNDSIDNNSISFKFNEILLNSVQINAIKTHCKLFLQWKQVHNLSSIHKIEDIVTNHYTDCLIGLKLINEYCSIPEIVHDLGSGAGFPGIIAAILWPNKYVNLIESSSKKSSFLKIVSLKTSLNMVKIINERVHKIQNIKFAITRAAFAPCLWNTLKSTMSTNGRIAFWISENTIPQKLNGWILEKEFSYCISKHIKRKIIILRNSIC